MGNQSSYERRIVIDSRVHFGKPCVAGTRILVEDVLELIQEGISFDEIAEKYYPDLRIEDIKACASYARTTMKERPFPTKKPLTA